MALRAKRKVIDPSGDWWGLYVTRTAMPHDPNDPGIYSRNLKILDDPLDLGFFGLPIALLQFLGRVTVKPLIGFLFSYAKGRRSGGIRVEAVSLYGARQTRYWTTTPEQVDSVLQEIATGLEQGHVVQPKGAAYLGARDC